MGQFHDKVIERLCRYAKIDTQSSNNSSTVPTTYKQFDLARVLYEELGDIGVNEREIDEKACVVYGWIPGNTEGEPLGLIAHMDTAPDAPGDNCKPRVIEHYDGSDIVLNKEKDIVMKTSVFPNLLHYIGDDLVVTDGTTLLGGDDKASIAAIMTYAEYLIAHPEIPHAKICLAFTPDEEVGGLARDLDLAKFGSPTAYTLDGDYSGYYMEETFHADAAKLRIHGVNVHTGTAKDKMINALHIAAQIINQIPENERPETTEGKEGFYHVYGCQGDVENTEITFIIRDFDLDLFQKREDFLSSLVDRVNQKYGEGTAEIEFIYQYRSMKEVIKHVPWLVSELKGAIEDAGLTPTAQAFRGGTDGSALSHRGLPCPNLSAGYENAHSRFEYVPVQSMEKNVEILFRLTERFLHIDKESA